MRIEYVTNEEEYGGLNTYSNNLFARLKTEKDIKLISNTSFKMTGLPLFLSKKVRSDLTHFTNQEIISPIVTKHKKFIVTVHDLTVLKMKLFDKSPSRFGKLAERIYNYKLSCLKNAQHIIAVSRNTKNDILEILNIPDESVSVTYEAADNSLKPLPNITKHKNTLLYIGNELPHKNLPTLFKAIAIVKKSIPDVKLIKIGSPGWNRCREELIRLAQELGIRKSVEFKQNVTNLCEEYNAATALILPSLYEGFGLPLVEAMACGCPIIASNISSIPEIAGRAALYIDPTNHHDIAEQILKLLSDNKLKNRLIQEGFKQNKLFNWKNCAAETVRVYNRILNNE